LNGIHLSATSGDSGTWGRLVPNSTWPGVRQSSVVKLFVDHDGVGTRANLGTCVRGRYSGSAGRIAVRQSRSPIVKSFEVTISAVCVGNVWGHVDGHVYLYRHAQKGGASVLCASTTAWAIQSPIVELFEVKCRMCSSSLCGDMC
jgi:hypothetical protein